MHPRRILHLAETFDVVPGLSDYMIGTEVHVMAEFVWLESPLSA
jgi:sialic acid synthase SpsE